MARRNRADSVTEQVKAAQAQIQPPSDVPLTDADMPFFANVIEEFARSEWSAHQLTLAAMLARMLSDLNREQQELRAEGYITVKDTGTRIENPRSRVVKSITGDILSMRRSLALHARARTGDNRDKATRSKVAKRAEIEDAGDDLLARPN